MAVHQRKSKKKKPAYRKSWKNSTVNSLPKKDYDVLTLVVGFLAEDWADI